MKRRSFLRTGSAVSLPILVNGFNMGFLPRSSFLHLLDENSDRILVLVQLDGGNDGLNTLIPLDQYSALSNARPGILIPENNVLPLYDHVGLHPSMTGFKSLFDEGKLLAIQGVAYPDQNRSHFRSTDIWQTGSSAEDYLTTGWVGRYFDSNINGYPEGYPNAEYPDPFAITIRAQVSETCQGLTANYSMAVTDPFNVYPVDETTLSDLPDTNFGHEMAFLIDALRQTNAYADTIVTAANKGLNLSTLYNEDSGLAQQLKTVALLINGGLQTKVYVVRIGGFDTHANQVQNNSTLLGDHAELLQELSDAIFAFQDDLKKMGIEKRVLGMTFSEFGRQISSNDSFGTDHGTAAPLFIFGGCAQGGIIGENPTIDQQLEPQEGVAMQHDFRAIYASILREWFGISEQDANALLPGDYPLMELTTVCSLTNGYDGNLPEIKPRPDISTVFPNPTSGNGNLTFESEGEWARISIYDGLGRRVAIIAERYFEKGFHTIPFDLDREPRGSYQVRIERRTSHESKVLVKI
jgi:uncharacterized protein (DUF1501 family)